MDDVESVVTVFRYGVSAEAHADESWYIPKRGEVFQAFNLCCGLGLAHAHNGNDNMRIVKAQNDKFRYFPIL
eukprot:449836-Amorphochlora_amoeboformis.AAC.3